MYYNIYSHKQICILSTIRNDPQLKKSIKEITQEIQAIMRQITASVTFLPLLTETCSFDLLVYTDKGAEVPLTWEDSDPCIIKKAADVQLRSFSTKVSYDNYNL